MKLLWASDAWDDYVQWQQCDPATLGKINLLLVEIHRKSFKGLGKPEPLTGSLAGWWYRRITGEHRLVYHVAGSGDRQQVEIVQYRFHY